MATKILGWEEAVTACDCCGRADLKGTFAVDIEGEIRHYGSVCATRNTGLAANTIKQAARAADLERLEEARREYLRSPEHTALLVRQDQARKAGLLGKPFADFCQDVRIADRETRQRIANQYQVTPSALF